MYAEDQFVPISALQHWLFCERQCALIHVERLWIENRLTVEGRHLHERAHDGSSEMRSGVHIARGVRLHSFRIGLYGVADVVEFCPATEIPLWNNEPYAQDTVGDHDAVFPVEYKRGRPKAHDADRIQLCAQAMCLEEMLDTDVSKGALFYGRTRKREVVAFSEPLRIKTLDVAYKVHRMVHSLATPTAKKAPKCDHCSLFQLCMPQAFGHSNKASVYLKSALMRPPKDDSDTEESP